MGWDIILQGLYERDKITIERLENAVREGLITEEEKENILLKKEDR